MSRDGRRAHSVFLGFREIAGYGRSLEQGFRDIGTRCAFANLRPNPHRYRTASDQPILLRMATASRERRINAHGPSGAAWRLGDRVTRLMVFAWALLRFDTYIFLSGESFFRHRELTLLRWLGKTTFFVYLGSDSRPTYINGAEIQTAEPDDINRAIDATRRKRESLRRAERHANWIVSHPPSSQLHARPFVPFLVLGFPSPAASDIASPPPTDRVRVLHAPSDPLGKGTAEIRAAVNRLADQGMAVELVELTGRPNSEVLDTLLTCHFVVDQVYADTPMGAFVAEAAAHGRAAVVGGYAWDEIDRLTPSAFLPPVLRCAPEGLLDGIRRLVTDVRFRDDLAAEALRFVREKWAPAQVAERYLSLVDGTFESELMVSPEDLRYVLGTAMPEHRVRQIVAAVIERAGPEGLSMEHNPGLRRRFMDLGSRAVQP